MQGGGDPSENRHLNPSRRKTVFNMQRKPSQEDRSGRLQPSNSLILLQETGSQQQAVVAEENKHLREYLETLKRNNRELVRRLGEKEQEIVRTDKEYKELVAKYRSELHRATYQTRILFTELPVESDQKTLNLRASNPRGSRERSEDSLTPRNRNSRDKLLQLKQTFEQINFREVQKILGKRNTGP